MARLSQLERAWPGMVHVGTETHLDGIKIENPLRIPIGGEIAGSRVEPFALSKERGSESRAVFLPTLP
jgi:hypothetical protein